MSLSALAPRPPPPQTSSSASLLGPEPAIPAVSLTTPDERPRFNEYIFKPLPPRPRKPSSIYSTEEEEIIDSYHDRHLKVDLDSYLSHSPKSQSVRSVDAAYEDRWKPRVQRKDTFHCSSDASLVSTLADEIAFRRDNRTDSNEDEVASRAAYRNNLAAEYERALPPSPLTPLDLSFPHSRNIFSRSSPPVSARISRVVDESLVPAPLHTGQCDVDTQSSSHISISSASTTSNRQSLGASFRSYAKKTMERVRPSAGARKHKREISTAPWKYPHTGNSPYPSQRRFSSRTSQSSGGIRDRLSGVYDALTQLSVTPSGLRPTLKISGNPGPHARRARSPAAQMTPYQHMGTKAWEKPRPPKPAKPQKPKSPTSPKSPLQRMSFLAMRAARSKEGNAEKRREELKKKIVVVRAADPGTDEIIDNWI
jgi:hypothetical protein